jgi:ribosome-associated translation inhibitor RaiA
LAAADLAEAMLSKALATARAKRDVDNEHIEASHKLYDEAMADELECEATLHMVQEEAVAAEHMVNMLETIDNVYEDLERVRDLSVAHAAHHQEQDIQTACTNAEQVALKAKQDMLNAEDSLHMLEKSEQELKAALKELQKAKQDLQMRTWQQKE